jgi:hypothetical protein
VVRASGASAGGRGRDVVAQPATRSTERAIVSREFDGARLMG